MTRISHDQVYAALAGVAIGGVIAPIVFPMAAAAQTACYVSSIVAAGTLAAGHQTGAVERGRERQRIVRASNQEVWIQQQASREALALRRIEINELVETLVMLDELTEVEQRHFLNELGLPELIDLYQQPLELPASTPQREEAVEVVKQPEPSPFGNEKLRWAVDNVIAQALQDDAAGQAEDEVDDAFAEIDLGRTVAEMMVSGDVPLCVLIACAPRTGKTTLLTTMIAWLHKLTEGQCGLHIWNGKEKINPETGELEDQFLGLVNDPTRYHPIRNPYEAKFFADQYHKGTEAMGKARRWPDVDICDEINNIREAVKAYDALTTGGKAKPTCEQVDTDSGLRITQGTSRNKFTVFTSHTSYVSDIGVSRGNQDGIYTLVLGRGGALDPIYKALKGSTAIVRNTVRAAKLLKDLNAWAESPNRDRSRVVVLTNLLGGTYQLFFVKHIDLSAVEFEAVQPQPQPEQEPEDPYEVWDDVYEDEFGHQPEEDMKPQSGSTRDRLNKLLRDELTKNQPQQPATKPSSYGKPDPSQQKLIDHLKGWISGLRHSPSDAELRAEVTRFLGVTLSDEAIANIQWWLSQADPTGIAEPATSGRFSAEYLTYLKSPDWQRRQERIVPKVCAGCNVTSGLQLHHRVYPPHGATLQQFIEQPDGQFSWLCEPCHRSLTQSIRQRRQQK